MKEYLGYGRSRDKNGDVEDWFFNEYVNCIHTSVGHSRMNMQVLVAEFDMGEIKYIGQMSSSQNSRVIDPEGISYAVTNGEKDGEPKIIEKTMKEVLPLNPDDSGLCRPLKAQYYKNGCANFLKTDGGSFAATGVIERDTQIKENHSEPLRIPQATRKGYIEVEPGGLFDMSYPESKTRRGRVQEGGTVSPTLMASGEGSCLYEGKVEQSYRIRKLTPKECFRLMGVSEGDIEKIQNSGVSRSQQYKMAGNSIVVDVLEYLPEDVCGHGTRIATIVIVLKDYRYEKREF